MERSLLAADMGIHVGWLTHRKGLTKETKIASVRVVNLLRLIWKGLSDLDHRLLRASGFYKVDVEQTTLTPFLVSDTIYPSDWRQITGNKSFKYSLPAPEEYWDLYCEISERIGLLEKYCSKLEPKPIDDSENSRYYLSRELQLRLCKQNKQNKHSVKVSEQELKKIEEYTEKTLNNCREHVFIRLLKGE